MTFNDYIQNPMGKKNAVFSQREMFRAMYAEKLDKILLREKGDIKYTLYKKPREDKFYIYIMIPSEVIDKFYYDVVIEFYHDKKFNLAGTQNLSNYDVRFFSNDPSFVFTFTHAFIKNDMFITEFSPKMSKQALTDIAKEKNPTETVGYVKSIFFAYLYAKQKGLLNKIMYINAKPYDPKGILKLIMQADEKIRLRQEAGADLAKQVRKEKAKPQNADKSLETITKYATEKIQATKVINTAKVIGKSKIARRSITTKKIK